MTEENETDYWCIDANIKSEIPYGPGGAEIRSGLRKFKGGAKVHIVGAFYGMSEDIVVIGPHRNTGKYISCIIRANTVENLRVKKIYSPQIIEFLREFQPNGAHMTTYKDGAYELMELIPSWASYM